jgi:hypothetical protein
VEWLIDEFAAGLVRVGGAIVMAYGMYRYAQVGGGWGWLILLPVGIGLALMSDRIVSWLRGV